jgi:hypothetical protein
MQTLQIRTHTLDWWHLPRSLAVSDMQLRQLCCIEQPGSVLFTAADRTRHTAYTPCCYDIDRRDGCTCWRVAKLSFCCPCTLTTLLLLLSHLC